MIARHSKDLYQILDHLVQGVQEISPLKGKDPEEGIKHYYKLRDRWIRLTVEKIIKLDGSKQAELTAFAEELKEKLPKMQPSSERMS